LKELTIKGSCKEDTTVTFDNLKLQGDIKIMIFDTAIDEKKELCHIWFNTGFVDENKLELSRDVIDTAWKDKKKTKRLSQNSL